VKELAGKTAVITGGASGIGRALADAFAAQHMKLVLADVEESSLRKAEEELAAAGASVVCRATDVSVAHDVEALADFAYDSFGAVHVLCNNAGVALGGPAWQATVKDWEWLLGVNLWGVIHGIRAFVPRMIAQGDECHVVNTSSGAGLHTRAFLGVYGATKHAVVAVSEAMYHELRFTATKVGVSVLCPAVVNTRIGEAGRNRPEGLVDTEGAANPAQMEAMEQAFRASLAAGLAPAEVASAVVNAVIEERFYILTHQETRERVKSRFEDILQDRNPTPL
jgi:NADP-dependent 3-hydroxy acid dehydrogenase YdfG